MKYSSINQITPKEINNLIQNSVPENQHLEYKQKIEFGSDKEKKELLADICAFANAEGGVIIYGIEEEKDEQEKNTGKPILKGLKGINCDKIKQTLNSSIGNNFEPHLIGVQVEERKVEDKTLLVIFIPRSSNPPHRVNFQGSKRFYKRGGTQRYEIPIEELRKDFLQGKELSQRISEFRSERIMKILSNETPIPFSNEYSPTLVLHIIPLSFFDNKNALEILKIEPSDITLNTPPGLSYKHRLNFDGWVSYQSIGDKSSIHYIQIFRNAIIEITEPIGCREKEIYPRYHEQHVIKHIKKLNKFLSKQNIDGACIIVLSLLNVKGYVVERSMKKHPSEKWNKKIPINRDHLLLPDIYLSNINEFKPEDMKPAFDLVWNAGDYPQSPNYDKDGKWIGD